MTDDAANTSRAAVARLTAPPPAGTSCECGTDCDCETDCDCKPTSHWHQRFMGVRCDSPDCDQTYAADVFAYTRAAANTAIVKLSCEAGWVLNPDATIVCPDCFRAALGDVITGIADTLKGLNLP